MCTQVMQRIRTSSSARVEITETRTIMVDDNDGVSAWADALAMPADEADEDDGPASEPWSTELLPDIDVDDGAFGDAEIERLSDIAVGVK